MPFNVTGARPGPIPGPVWPGGPQDRYNQRQSSPWGQPSMVGAMSGAPQPPMGSRPDEMGKGMGGQIGPVNPGGPSIGLPGGLSDLIGKVRGGQTGPVNPGPGPSIGLPGNPKAPGGQIDPIDPRQRFGGRNPQLFGALAGRYNIGRR